MTDPRSTDRLLSAWLELEAPASAPDALRTDIDRATARIRPRPAWLARLGGHHMDVIHGGARRRDTRLVPLLALLGLLIAGAVAAVWIGSRPPATDLTAVGPSASAAESTGSPSATPAPSAFADASAPFPYIVHEIITGDDAMWVSITGEDTNEQARAIYRVDPATAEATLVVDEIPFESPQNHLTIVEMQGSVWVVEDEAGRMLQFDGSTGELLGEIPLGNRPLEPIAGVGAVWSENFGDGTVTRIDPATGEVVATIDIPPFNGGGPRDLAVGASLLWAVAPDVPTLVGIDPETNTVAREVALDGSVHCGVHVVAGRVFASSCEVATVPTEVIDDATGVPQGTYEGEVAIAENGTYAWIPEYAETTRIKALDPETLRYAGPVVDLGVPVSYVTSGHGHLWYGYGTDLFRLSLDALPN